MKVFATTAVLVIGYLLVNCPTAYAQEPWYPLSYTQRKAYYACLTSAWVADFCRGHSWGISTSYELTYNACVTADTRGPRVAVNPDANLEEYCWRRSRGLVR